MQAVRLFTLIVLPKIFTGDSVSEAIRGITILSSEVVRIEGGTLLGNPENRTRSRWMKNGGRVINQATCIETTA
jgi:hypothetical protein